MEGAGAEASDCAPGGLDLDDLCAELGEHHGAVGAEPDVGEVEDPDVVEYLGHLNPVFDGGSGYLYCGPGGGARVIACAVASGGLPGLRSGGGWE